MLVLFFPLFRADRLGEEPENSSNQIQKGKRSGRDFYIGLTTKEVKELAKWRQRSSGKQREVSMLSGMHPDTRPLPSWTTEKTCLEQQALEKGEQYVGISHVQS